MVSLRRVPAEFYDKNLKQTTTDSFKSLVMVIIRRYVKYTHLKQRR
jgi:hypothetical protein